eukprot:206086_1
MCSLSLDIETFYEQTRSSTASIKAAEQILRCIRKCVYELQDKCKKEFNDFDPNLRIRNAKSLCFEHMFQSIRHPYFWWNVFKFGSQALGTSYGSESDHDIAITVNFNNTREDSIYLLRELTHILSGNVKSWRITPLLHATYPIIQAQCKTSMIKFDISIADAFCEHTQQIMQNYIQYFEQNGVAIKPFIVFVKHWAKQNGINDGYHRFLNSFGYTILVIKFLQIFCAHYGYPGHSLSTLLFGFYYLFAVEFNPTKHSISIITNSSAFDVKMNIKCCMEIVDPANKNNNVAHNVRSQQWHEIQQVFIKAHGFHKRSQVNCDPKESLFCLLTNSKQEHHNVHDHAYSNKYQPNGLIDLNSLPSTLWYAPWPYQHQSNGQNEINHQFHHASTFNNININKKARYTQSKTKKPKQRPKKESHKKKAKQKTKQNPKKQPKTKTKKTKHMPQKKKRKEAPNAQTVQPAANDHDEVKEMEPIGDFPIPTEKIKYRSRCHNNNESGPLIIETQTQKIEYCMHLADEMNDLFTHSMTNNDHEQRVHDYITKCVRHLQQTMSVTFNKRHKNRKGSSKI